MLLLLCLLRRFDTPRSYLNVKVKTVDKNILGHEKNPEFSQNH